MRQLAELASFPFSAGICSRWHVCAYYPGGAAKIEWDAEESNDGNRDQRCCNDSNILGNERFERRTHG